MQNFSKRRAQLRDNIKKFRRKEQREFRNSVLNQINVRIPAEVLLLHCRMSGLLERSVSKTLADTHRRAVIQCQLYTGNQQA